MLRARGYFDHRTQPFDVGAAELRDVGPIALAPSAVLSVEVLGPDGSPIETFTVSLDGVELHGWAAYDCSPGRARWDGLVAGTAKVSVSTPGMAPVERAVTLSGGAVAEARFELR